MHRKVLSPAAALLLATRELFELPLVVRLLASRDARPTEVDRGSNRAGKIATTVELFAIACAIAVPRVAPFLLVVAGATGAVAGISYWKREIEAEEHQESRTYEPIPAHV
jgi:CDP-diacylglycerol--glycerol-3-phosphate 3-phosphatidyltransferase/cardiolipin synthase